MHPFTLLRLDHLRHPVPAVLVVGAGVAIVAIWSFLVLEAVRVKSTKSTGQSSGAKRNGVLAALFLSLLLAGAGDLGYQNLLGLERNQFAMAGHRICQSWHFGSILPEEPPAATLSGHYMGVAEYTCADAGEHFVDLSNGKRIPEPIGFFSSRLAPTQ